MKERPILFSGTKVCALCTRRLPAADFYRSGKYLHSYCKLCHRDRTLELRAAKSQRETAICGESA